MERPSSGQLPACGSRDHLPRVLAYHKVTRFELGGTWVPPGRFPRQIDAVREAGFRFIDEDGFLEALDGRREGSRREILLTFDDGYRCLLDRAIPALEARGIPALIFVPSAYVGRENSWELNLPGRRFRHLDGDEIADLARRGFSFGSHARTHRDLTRLSGPEVRDELERSKEELEALLPRSVRSVSFPFGRSNGSIRRAAERAGYRAAFTLYPEQRGEGVCRFDVRREAVYVIDTERTIRAKLGDGIGFALEDIKGRAINAFADLTPFLKDGFSRSRRTGRRARPGR